MRRRRLPASIVLTAVAACGAAPPPVPAPRGSAPAPGAPTTTPPTTTPPTTTPPTTASPTTTPPTTTPPTTTPSPPPPTSPSAPPPTITWVDGAIDVRGLPAVADDGSLVVLAHRDNDGGRGNPNLTLIVRDRADRELARHVVLTADEADRLSPAQLAERFTAGQRFLTGTRAGRHVHPLLPLTAANPVADPPPPAVGGAWSLRWTPTAVELTERGQPPRSLPARPDWLAPDHPMCPTCGLTCHNPPFLRAGHLDAALGVLVVVIAYRGTDTCWEPSDAAHVITWPPPR